MESTQHDRDSRSSGAELAEPQSATAARSDVRDLIDALRPIQPVRAAPGVPDLPVHVVDHSAPPRQPERQPDPFSSSAALATEGQPQEQALLGQAPPARPVASADAAEQDEVEMMLRRSRR